MKKIGLASLVLLLVMVLMVDPLSSSSAQEAKTLEDRVAALEAQVALLQTQVAPSDPQTRPKGSTPTVAAGSKPVEILDFSSADAGIGDGTIYVYVDIRNNSNQLFEFVNVDVTCRDSSDRVVATGSGIESNLGPGEQVTSTVIVLSAQGCKTIQVRVEPMNF